MLSPPALDPLPIYETRVVDGAIEVRLDPPGPARVAAAEREEQARTVQPTVAGPSLEGLTLEDVDLTDLDRWVEGVPYDWFALLRRYAPLHWQDERDGRASGRSRATTTSSPSRRTRDVLLRGRRHLAAGPDARRRSSCASR